MDNLHRELAPVSGAAWAQIEEEAARTFKRHLAGRRVVDVHGLGGYELSAVGTGRVRDIDAPAAGVLARQRLAASLVELRAAFTLDRREIAGVERGAQGPPMGSRTGIPPASSPSRRTARSSTASRPPASTASGRAPATRR